MKILCVFPATKPEPVLLRATRWSVFASASSLRKHCGYPWPPAPARLTQCEYQYKSPGNEIVALWETDVFTCKTICAKRNTTAGSLQGADARDVNTERIAQPIDGGGDWKDRETGLEAGGTARRCPYIMHHS